MIDVTNPPTQPRIPAKNEDQSRRSQGSQSEAVEHSEGSVARAIEQQTAKLPSDIFLWGAIGSVALSLCSHLSGRRNDGLLFGQWVAPFLILGVYNKIVKVAGSDQLSQK